MSFSVGIVGLPNVGKSTLFTALTAQEVDTSNYPFATIDPNVGVVAVPDDRLDAIKEIILPQETTPTAIEFVDIAGLVRGAHEGEGLGNEFLNHIQRVDAILHVVRAFHDDNVEHVEGSPDPQRDHAIIVNELRANDQRIIDAHREKIEGTARSGNRSAQQELALLLELQDAVENHTPPRREEVQKLGQKLGVLSTKPEIVVLNVSEDDETTPSEMLSPASVTLNIQKEADMVGLTVEEREELGLESHLADIITQCYASLDLITFFTIKGGAELRAWTVPEGTTAPKAGGVVHNDFEEQFIKAEVLEWEDLVNAEGWKHARSRGLIRTEGKEYVVQDGDVIEFKI